MFMQDCLGKKQLTHYSLIPEDTDILISHTPPLGILDFDDGVNYGSEELLMQISALNLKAHLFGHIHSQFGLEVINGTTFSNGSLMDSNYSSLRTPRILSL